VLRHPRFYELRIFQNRENRQVNEIRSMRAREMQSFNLVKEDSVAKRGLIEIFEREKSMGEI